MSGGLTRGLGWLGFDVARPVAIGLTVALAWSGIALLNTRADLASEKEMRHNAELNFHDEQAAHAQTKANVALAQADAAAMDAANMKRVASEFNQAMETLSHDNETLRDSLRDNALRFVRAQTGGANIQAAASARGGATVPGLAALPSGSVQATCAAGIPEGAILTQDDALKVADGFAQLQGMIDAWHAASRIDPSGSSAVTKGN